MVYFRTQFAKNKSVCNLVKIDDFQLWCECLGHLNFTDARNKDVRNSHCAEDVSEVCVLFKITKVSFPKETEVKSTKPLDKEFVEILEPLNLPRVDGFIYVLMIVDG